MFSHISQLPKRLWILLSIGLTIILAMAACAPGQIDTPEAPEPTLTEEPQQTPTEAPITTPTEEPQQTPPDVPIDFDRSVVFALPRFAAKGNPIILVTAPLASPPTDSVESLSSDQVVVIGFFEAMRDLPISGQENLAIPPGRYLVMVRQSQMVFLNMVTRNEIATSLAADIRTLGRNVDPPEAIITIKDLCYSWGHAQVCTQPAPMNALTEEESSAIHTEMEKAVNELVNAGLIEPGEINIDGAIPDFVGEESIRLQEASLIAAPTVNFPSEIGDVPVDGALLGVFDVLLPVHVETYPDLDKGIYAVFAVSLGNNEWIGKFIRTDQMTVEVPGTYFEARGQIEEPLAILIGIRIGLCWFERCK